MAIVFVFASLNYFTEPCLFITNNAGPTVECEQNKDSSCIKVLIQASYYLTTITLSYHSKPYLYKDLALAVVTLCITKLNILYLWSDIVTCTNSDAEIAGASPGASEDRRV